VQGPQAIELALQGAAAVVTAGVVVAEHAGGGHGQAAQLGGDARLAIAEVAHQQQAIHGQAAHQFGVALIPGTMRIPHHRQAPDPHLPLPRLNHPAP
jgi:hypothetical protein